MEYRITGAQLEILGSMEEYGVGAYLSLNPKKHAQRKAEDIRVRICFNATGELPADIQESQIERISNSD